MFLSRRVFSEAISNFRQILRTTGLEFEKGIEDYRIFRETNDTPDWGVVRMSSYAMCKNRPQEARKFLEEQFKEVGGSQRQARHVQITEAQINANLERVLKSNIETGIRFYEFLLDFRFCANRDVYLETIIEYIFKNDKNNWKYAIEVLNRLQEKQKSKSFKMSAYHILKSSVDSEKDLAELVKPRTLRNLRIFLRLETSSFPEVLDYCRSFGKFESSDVDFHIEIAGKLRSFEALENLLELYGGQMIIPMPKGYEKRIVEEFIKISGKSGNLEKLERSIQLTRTIEMEDRDVLYAKIRHFYKCLNVKPPVKLYE
ncbi:unnamed protein product [Caenorhabditis angaria]|uniref:Uncharacterized protein n=1 Tax=Caenorhabditis angaria TaxID=860376 RepID=A0A9P1ITV9_9PELO|nr:unnamed protein product [Caenorhabditis angaria]